MQNGRQTLDKSPECLGHWTLEFGYYLEFGYWDLGFQARNGDRELLQSCWVIIIVDVSRKDTIFDIDLYKQPVYHAAD